MDAEEHTCVLIVGGGLAGLATSAFLAMHGVESLLVERHTGFSPHPRSRGLNPRTMELLRLLGLEERVRATESARALAGNAGILAVETLRGRELGRLDEPYFAGVADPAELSPASWCMCHQDELEPLLADRARELGAVRWTDRELAGFRQDGDGVTAKIRNRRTGTSTVLRADYLVAADGAAGTTRERLGIGTHGPGALAHFTNIAFEADLTGPLGDRRFIMCYTTGAGVRCALLPVNNTDRWMLHVMCEPGERFDEERCAALVRAAVGDDALPVRIVSALPWESAGRVADRFSDGRVFLVGDAAHVMPPSGAFGANTGFQDAHALAWRLAAITRGEADPALADGYDAERRPVAEHTMEQAVLRSRDRPRLGGGAGNAPPPDPRIAPDEDVIFGPRPDGSPGRRAPHVPIVWNGVRSSTLDRYRDRFVLGCGPAADSLWREAAASLDVPVDAYTGDDAWCAAHGVTDGGAVLVRPDGIVAWRFETLPPDPAARLAEALGGVLRPAGSAAPERSTA